MPWIERRLRGATVWARCDAQGALIEDGGRADVLYKRGGKVYRALARNLDGPGTAVISDEDAAPSGPAEPPAKTAAPRAKPGQIGNGPLAGASAAPAADAIHVYTDGACTGNPGPMGIGVVVLCAGAPRREISEYLGQGTNNIAELTAILRGLEGLPRDRTIFVYSDSSYALGLLGKGWKAKANQELVERLRAVAREFSDVRWVKVAGHAGVPENERCDELARTAILRRR